jgi:hypothetical protein
MPNCIIQVGKNDIKPGTPRDIPMDFETDILRVIMLAGKQGIRLECLKPKSGWSSLSNIRDSLGSLLSDAGQVASIIGEGVTVGTVIAGLFG